MIVIFNDIVGITRSERESMRMTDRMEAVFFQYGETEIDYLKRKDKRLGEVIDKVGHMKRSRRELLTAGERGGLPFPYMKKKTEMLYGDSQQG